MLLHDKNSELDGFKIFLVLLGLFATLFFSALFFSAKREAEYEAKLSANINIKQEISEDLYNMVKELKEESKKHRLNLVISKIEEISKDGSITYEEIKLLKEAFQENKKIKLINQLKD